MKEGNSEPNSCERNQDARILDLIEKLLRLSDSPNRHEAEAAAVKAQSLILKYNVDTARLTGLDNDPVICSDFYLPFKRPFIWQKKLVLVIAEHNLCRAVFSVGTNWFQFVGRKSNIKAVELMVHKLLIILSRMATIATREFRQEQEKLFQREDYFSYKMSKNIAPNSYRNSWLSGAVDGIREALKRNFQEVSSETAIVAVFDQEIDNKFKELFPSAGSQKVNTPISEEGYLRGLLAGMGLDLREKKELEVMDVSVEY
ncbi:MAG: DUF2786 domain-containing protein [Anaerolineaceae bacterium]|jgi:hypothetical protein